MSGSIPTVPSGPERPGPLWNPGSRVAEYLPDADVTLQEEWNRYVEWLLDRQTRPRDAFAAVGGAPAPAGE